MLAGIREYFNTIILRQQNEALSQQNKVLHASLQALVDNDALTYEVTSTNTHYTGNPYPTYAAKIAELAKKYDGSAAWGCGMTRSIIDTRAAFILGSGVIPYKLPQYTDKQAERELNYIKEFIRINNLDTILPRAWARESEIEGKALIHLLQQPNDQIRVIHIPYREKSYEIAWDEANYDPYHYLRATYKGVPDFNWGEDEFLFVRFGGLGNAVASTPSKISLALRNIEDLDKNHWDWRKINHLYASPTPHFKVQTVNEARTIWDWIKLKNWRIGKAFVSTAEFSLVGHKSEGYASLKDEAETHVKQISGITGVPPQLLGYPDLLSNRSTADSLMESLVLGTNEERGVWEGGYDQLFRKVLNFANLRFNKSFDINVIGARIPFISAEKLKELTEVWLPLKVAGVIDLTTLLSHVPEIDREAVEKKVKEEIDEQHRKELELLKMNKREDGNTPSAKKQEAK